jgi:hypothetical protein
VSLGSVKAQSPGNYPHIDTLYVVENYNTEYFGKNWPATSDPDTAYQRDEKAAAYYRSQFEPYKDNFFPFVFENCTSMVRIEFDRPAHPDSTFYVSFNPYPSPPDFPNDIGKMVNLISEKFLVPKYATYMDIPIITSRVPDELNMDYFAVEVFINQQLAEYLPFYCINKFSYNIKYTPPTVKYEGRLKVDIDSPSGQTLYSLNGGLSWKLFTDTATKSEIKNLENYNVIIIKEPLTCDYTEIPIERGGEQPIIYRQIRIPQVTDAILDKLPGMYSIPSQENFTFTIQPTGENIGKIPVVQTNRTSIPDSEGVIITKNENGTYTITIRYIQQNIDISIDFATGNEIVLNENIRTHNGQLYITTTTTGNVKVYSATGALVKTIPTIAGETASTSLPTGFYIINMDGKSYKVVCK